jgi:hypothetical protein
LLVFQTDSPFRTKFVTFVVTTNSDPAVRCITALAIVSLRMV